MLIVSNVKLRQIREAIEQWVSGVLVIRGPSGCGKMSALSHVCTTDLEVPKFVNAGDQDIISLAVRLNGTPEHRPIIVVSRDAWQLERVTNTCSLFPNVLTVFLLEENDLSYKRLSNLMVISMAGFSDTAIRKLVGGLAPIPPDVADEIVSIAGGDARQALLQLAMRNIPLNDQSICPDRVVRRKRKNVTQSTTTGTTSKDNAFSLFHTLGKILYNKQGNKRPDCKVLARQPIVLDSGDVCVSTLHENIPDFVADMCVLSNLMEVFVAADCWLHDNDKNWFVFQAIATLNTTQNEERPMRGFTPFRRAAIKDCRKKLEARKSLLVSIRGDLGWWADTGSIEVLDVIMGATKGSFPADMPLRTKRMIYEFCHGEDENFLNFQQQSDEPHIQPCELEEDPVEDC
jgi:hypothetical protein